MFLLGLAGLRTKRDPQQVAQLLSQSIDFADDKVEAYQALAQAYLLHSPPDLKQALQANEKLRALPLLGEKILAPARLLGGELLLELKRHKEARDLLSRIGADAPGEVGWQARTLRAQSHQDAEQWSEAANLWEDLLSSNLKMRSTDRGEALFRLGLCYRRMKQIPKALKTWKRCIEKGSLMAANASRLAVCEAGLESLEPAVIRNHFVRVTDKISEPEDWVSDHITLKDAQNVFEKAIRYYLTKKLWDSALALSLLYEKLGPPGGALFFQGETRRLWAVDLDQKLTPKSAQQRFALYRQAGEAYDKARALFSDPRASVQSLWLASLCYSQGHSPTQTIRSLQEILKEKQLPPEQTGEAYYRLGKALLEISNEKEAETAFTQCLSYPGKFAYRSRFELGQIEYRRGDTGPAAEILRDNLKQLRRHPDNLALESTLYVLGRIVYERKTFEDVRQYLKEAVERFPNSSWAQRGRYQLAEATFTLGRERQKAHNPDQGDPKSRELLAEEGRRLVKESALLYREIQKRLPKDPGLIDPLTTKEQAQIVFREADALWWAGEYQESLKAYESIAANRVGSPDQLLALGYSLRCYIGLLDQKGFTSRVEMIREIAKKYDATTQQRYEKWIDVMRRSFSVLKDTGE